jgi:hypothetical protein
VSVGRRQTRRKRRVLKRRTRLRDDANGFLIWLIAGVYSLTKSIEWRVLFFAMMFSLVLAVASSVLGEVVLAGVFSGSSVLLVLALWTRELE